MKKKLSILLITCSILVFKGYGQDSARTINDKPGTPQSLRTVNTAPKNQLHVINTNTAPNQTINHGATESNDVNNKQEQTIVSDPNAGKTIPKNNTITVNNSTSHTDSITSSSSVPNKPGSNVTNPTRK